MATVHCKARKDSSCAWDALHIEELEKMTAMREDG